MSRRPPTDESTVDADFAITVPAIVRERSNVEPGDTIRWHVGDEGTLTVEVVKPRYGAFSDLEPVDVGERTDAAADHDEIPGTERRLSSSTRTSSSRPGWHATRTTSRLERSSKRSIPGRSRRATYRPTSSRRS